MDTAELTNNLRHAVGPAMMSRFSVWSPIINEEIGVTAARIITILSEQLWDEFVVGLE